MSSIQYEKLTLDKMIRLYCRKKHNSKNNAICSDCLEVRNYAHERLDRCLFGDEKGACAKCFIHCYKKDMKEKVKIIMRFSAPRMLIYHPFDFLIHYAKDKFVKQKRQS